MILSFHPCYEGDVNRLCAGRDPGKADLKAIRSAAAVVLPQGCRETLYRMARENCPHVFPDFEARFRYPGKTGQIRLFQRLHAPHPRTWVFVSVGDFYHRPPGALPNGFPLVFKLDWGGQGETVRLINDAGALKDALATAAAHERSGQRGFLLQAVVPHAQRTLRVVVIGQSQHLYWRVQERPFLFGTSVANGARIDTRSDPHLRQHAMELTRDFCRRSGINLAGFDLLFDASEPVKDPPTAYFLEINYFFGRTGLGGSEAFYRLLQTAIDRWLAGLGMTTTLRMVPRA